MSHLPSSDPEPTRPFQFSIRKLMLWVTLVGLFLATDGCGLIGIHYPRAVENDPLLAPIKVVSAAGHLLELADGRQFVIDSGYEPLEDIPVVAGDFVDIEPQKAGYGAVVDSKSEQRDYGVRIYGKERGWICGTPWVRLINFPLIPDDIPINHRRAIGYGRLVQTGPKFSSVTEKVASEPPQ